MENRLSLFFGALAGVVLVAILAGVSMLLLDGSGAAQAQQDTPGINGMRQITVIGEGSVGGVPDTARVEIGVETTGDTTSDALAENNAQTETLIDRLQELGVAENDIQTRNFNIYPVYNDNGQEIRGYTVSNTVMVVIRDLQQTGTLLDEVVQVGANRIYGVSFSVDEPDELLAQARDEAIANARERAEAMAQAIGASVGEVLVISENIGAGPAVPMPRAEADGMGGAAPASVPIQAGEQEFFANVQVTFELR